MPAYKIAFVFVGSMVGAGFASGKEAWQFFGVFNLKGIAGVGLAIAMYCFLGYISIAIAGKLKTGDISKIMCPIENSFIQGFVGVAMCAFLLLAYVAMLAAGGSLLWEQFGLPHAIGSLIYMLLAVLTALGGFERLASRIGKVVPLLVGGTLIIALYIIFFDSSMPEEVYNGQASVFASHWAFAAVSYVGYNMTAAVPVLGQCALRTKDSKIAIRGTLLGGLLLGLFSLTLFCNAYESFFGGYFGFADAFLYRTHFSDVSERLCVFSSHCSLWSIFNLFFWIHHEVGRCKIQNSCYMGRRYSRISSFSLWIF